MAVQVIDSLAVNVGVLALSGLGLLIFGILGVSKTICVLGPRFSAVGVLFCSRCVLYRCRSSAG